MGEETYTLDEVPTVPTPSREEYRDRYEHGKQLGLDTALEKTVEIQQRLPYQMAAVGSVASHPDVYGERTLRTTDKSLDVVTPVDDLDALAEDYDIWQYGNCFSFDYDGFAVGVIPADAAVFADDTLGTIRITQEELDDSNTLNTAYGPVTVVPPEIGYASKARRYTQCLLNNDYVKRNDLADMANISLRHVREADGVYDREQLASYINDYTQHAFNEETDWRNDLQQRIDPNINLADWKDLVQELDAIQDTF